ncbi:hypothetical protein R6Q57_012200 [Mikania cordata]
MVNSLKKISGSATVCISYIPADAIPFPHRTGNLFKTLYSVNWNDSDHELEANYLNQSRVTYEFITMFVSRNSRSRGTNLNYRDLDNGVMKREELH